MRRFSSNDVFVPRIIVVSSLDKDLLKKAFSIVEDNIENENFDFSVFSLELGVSRSMLFTKTNALTKFTPSQFAHMFLDNEN